MVPHWPAVTATLVSKVRCDAEAGVDVKAGHRLRCGYFGSFLATALITEVFLLCIHKTLLMRRCGCCCYVCCFLFFLSWNIFWGLTFYFYTFLIFLCFFSIKRCCCLCGRICLLLCWTENIAAAPTSSCECLFGKNSYWVPTDFSAIADAN